MADSIQNNSAPIFVGEFCHAIDGKHRITVPANWRFEEEVELILLPASNKPCLKALPRAEIDRIRSDGKISQAQRAALLQRIGTLGRRVILDKSGRLTIPETFCQQFKLSDEVTLTGAIETFEVWNPGDFGPHRDRNMAISEEVAGEFGL